MKEKLTETIPASKIVSTIKCFLELNAGDESTELLLISLGAEMLDTTSEEFSELVGGDCNEV